MRDLVRRLAEMEPTDLPVLSIYLDMRPQATGQSPGRRASLTVLRDRFREIERALGPRGDDVDSFTADVERIQSWLDEEFDRASQGVAIFACSGAGLWETVETGAPFEDEVSVDAVPRLFQLARLLDEQQTAVVAIVDTNTARLFVSRTGGLEELEGPDEDPVHHRKRSTGGWSEARYQRHIDKHDATFAKEAAEALQRLVDRHEAERVIVGGDEVAVPLLLDALPQAVRDRVGEVIRVDMRAPIDEIGDEVRPVLERLEAEASQSAADRLVAAVRGSGLGVGGVDATRRALEQRQVMELLLAADAELDETTRNDLIREAAANDATVEVVEEHDGLRRLGGVGALLRFKVEEPEPATT